MDREAIERELQEYRDKHAQAIANANAIWGVVQYLERKLAETPQKDNSR